MIFKTDAEKAFGVETYLSPEMEAAIKLWTQIEGKNPPWLSDCDGHPVSFSNTVARELAKLITQNIDIKVQKSYGDGEKAAFIQKEMDVFLQKSQEVMERVIRLGGVMAKWGNNGMEYIPPNRFLVTSYDSNGNIDGVIFFFRHNEQKVIYTLAEWHRYEDVSVNIDGVTKKTRAYKVSNKAFKSDVPNELGREIPLSQTKWDDLLPEYPTKDMKQNMEIKKPLYTYIKNPYSNTIDPDSPLGVSCFAECIEELRWLDIAMSTMGIETEGSAPVMFVDANMVKFANEYDIKLPKFVRKLDLGGGAQESVEQWQPQLQVQSRIEGINFLLNIISVKCGLDTGYFVFNGQAISMATATQVEASERRTINTVLQYRGLLDRPESNGDGRVGAIHDIAYIIDAMSVMPLPGNEINIKGFGNYKIFAKFADLQRNAEEEKLFDYQLAQNGFMSKERFLVRNLGMTEEEAAAMVAEAQAEQQPEAGGLFDEE